MVEQHKPGRTRSRTSHDGVWLNTVFENSKPRFTEAVAGHKTCLVEVITNGREAGADELAA